VSGSEIAGEVVMDRVAGLVHADDDGPFSAVAVFGDEAVEAELPARTRPQNLA
jgi:hypothetical protein